MLASMYCVVLIVSCSDCQEDVVLAYVLPINSKIYLNQRLIVVSMCNFSLKLQYLLDN